MPPRRTNRPARRGSAEGRASGAGSWLGVALIALALFLIGAGVWFYQSQRSELVELNPADLCPRDTTKAPPAVYVVLVDQTDPLPALQRRSVTNAVLEQMRTDLERGDDRSSMRHARVEIWAFGDRQPGAPADMFELGGVVFSLGRVLSICNPGPPERWDHLYKNADVVKRRHHRFYAELEAQLLTSLSFPEAKQSPVLEATYGIGVRVFSAQQVRNAQKRLILVSDLMQNTKTLSFFSGPIDYEQWQKRREARLTRPDLRDVAVTALMIPGARADLQKASLANFWTAVFRNAGALNGDHDQLRRVQ